MFPSIPAQGLASHEFMQGFLLGQLAAQPRAANNSNPSFNSQPLLVNRETAAKFLGISKTSFHDLLHRAEEAGTVDQFRVEILPGIYRYSLVGLSLIALNQIKCFDKSKVRSAKEGLCR